MSVKKGQELELTIESLAYGGKGVARVDDFVIFVKNAIPGQKVRALLYRKRKGFGEARPLEVLSESKHAVEPRCHHFPTCGGCKVQQLNYDEQVAQKKQQIENIFRRQAGIENFEVDAVVPADQIFNYRNKMEFTFSNNRWVLHGEPEDVERDFALGMHIPKRWDKILNIDECHIQPQLGNEIINKARSLAKELKLKPYDQKTHNGFLRYLLMRFGQNTGDILLNLVTSYENADLLQPMVNGLIEAFPQITTIVNNINTRKADVAFGEYELHLHGKPALEERIGDLTFEISANSFFQTNTGMAEKLYETALEGAELSGEEVVFDLYCGTGSISLFLAQKAKEVHGFEVIVSAVEDATRNAIRNGVGNAKFHVANLDNFFKFGVGKKYPKPDVIVVDPPRAGMHKFMANYLPKFGAEKIVYISCNPTTQARDTEILHMNGYKLKHLTMVDMFPHTPHVETVGIFVKR
ncbi:MAG: 23S rRNA (uracil(1939)-C(5))-methyltransferase RlmD [Candidatus Marinimicrobia bacterium]|jgi:23S rRNA (uracil1939-C5)-methyltransferase|nr:23S rRNA (uracil(1939)-C(5))-methyltransferase RlmD [Candidatus Neomarinimicrobiota bacterium]MBT3676787.1 23S rRNA (uracil(1939)-C(5))-methyltransferase RlmD [Candidatus Neomarinimicrobiota bacterium]MBT3762661.1 23S rRNA (uracil(1939)-C(5))-methyltransferase RlmD [Candidatus Neomarinimicrobiota bacterium]MBT4069531.1 23S rRNA (uracil(1939)-C(5))-methyltransferase RlmD [Candidatus Neomarinimicrobiota bacterium]MBT4270531.1 23S rRNA (uracil(1939)-C(5))-methyltransferase RlmD [Candidatus Neom